jgi:nicotinate-nucleotide--dimethylbenzimidazole phosphoribosyltransferase
MAGDHGVAAEGVSAYPSEVTAQMVLNFLAGGAGINVLARHVGARVVVVDCGVASDIGSPAVAGLVVKKVAKGTRNMAQGPAMTRAQAVRSLEVGVDVLEEELPRGIDICGVGDMGIANTTPSSAIVSVLAGRDPAEVTGRGTGITDEAWLNKVRVVRRALEVNKPDPGDPLDVLAKVGGFEIGGIAGLCLAAASHRIPVVIDGFISTAGAMIACAIEPKVKGYLIAAHRSVEPGHQVMLEWLGTSPLLDLGMRLGEGTGAALGISLVEAGVRILNEMASFDEAGVSRRTDDE